MARETQHDHDSRRRTVLRRAAALAATTVGAGAVAAVAVPGTAQAAPGDDLTMGESNESGPATTTLSAASGPGTLVLTNTAGAPLRLVPSESLYPQVLDSEVGTVAVDDMGDLFVRAGHHSSERDGTNGWAWTSEWATTSVTVEPTRVLDTRDADLRRHIVSGAGTLDSAGRVVPGKPIVVSLDSFVRDGYAMKGNVTVVGMTGPGVLTVWGSGPKPNASTLNWATTGTILSNFLFTELGAVGAWRSVITIDAISSPTHVIVDLTSLLVGHPSQVTGA
ncbi:hypothetical protein GA0070616_1237 [Micromonospora nigra]|uniref:Tat (Twin-arginine translocation) pathway signal sequence n=1 Tax=Micromonospora nigra TaxID=145857 RepID=A0A1C6RJB0_9ACTN|nr:hypothetical protein [Micromonospora nigra]SCL17258.1 hypothetical protein GA0070616_1237 [Micromonospora nigra]